jgi:predicted HicB family RNase H-like nuclease
MTDKIKFEVLPVSFSDKVWALALEAAQAEGVSVSDFVINAIREKLERPKLHAFVA